MESLLVFIFSVKNDSHGSFDLLYYVNFFYNRIYYAFKINYILGY